VITGGYPQGRRFCALKARTGAELWQNAKGSPYTTTPVVHDGLLYVVSDRGVIGCYNVADGKLVYQERIGRGGSYSASPVIAGGRLFAGTEEGEMNVIRTGSTFEFLGTNTFPEGIWSTPAFSDRAMFVRTAGALYAIGAS
jgi:outer membrane protein assembly factor BamB